MNFFTIVLCFFVFSNTLIAQKNIDNIPLTESCVIDYIPFDTVEKYLSIKDALEKIIINSKLVSLMQFLVL